MTNVLVVIGAGQIGQATARRVGVGKNVLLAICGRITPMQLRRFWGTRDTR